MKTLVISAVNLVEGGTLRILIDSVKSARSSLPDWRIIVLLNNSELIDTPGIEILIFPKIKSSWLRRIYFEWFYCRKLSKILHADLWLSLHDTSPFVHARRQAVYCHNPSPFYDINIYEAWIEPIFLIFTLLYKFIYRINISSNYYVVVQQDWIRTEFINRYPCRSVIVARPSINIDIPPKLTLNKKKDKFIFLYPALARVFKNFEVICEAAQRLPPSLQSKIKIYLTIDGTENRYAKSIINRYKHIHCIQFIGRQNWDSIKNLYATCDAVLFPSRLETWGLPISECMAYKKPLLVADLAYARETIGNYDKVSFVHPKDVFGWASKMTLLINDNLQFDGNQRTNIDQPYAEKWENLWEILTNNL